MKKNILYAIIALVAILAVGSIAMAYAVNSTVNVNRGGVYNNYEATQQEVAMGAMPSGDIYSPVNVYDTLRGDIYTETISKTSVGSSTTLRDTDSGKTFLLSASGTTITLPSVSAGLNFRFVVNGALDTGNVIIDSAEGDNIEGTLIVAGAVVDCASEDQINFVVDGENIGDYVELMSDGSQWLIGDSGALTSGKLTCTDPS